NGTWSPATVSNTASATYTFTPGAGQCAVPATLSVDVNLVSATSVDAQICNGQTFTLPDGSTVSVDGSYPVTLTNVNGCDSVVTTNVLVIDVINTSVNASICSGESFTLPDGNSVSAQGDYPVTLLSSGGCDSIVTTRLTVNAEFNIEFDDD